jgi:hypothetical protein
MSRNTFAAIATYRIIGVCGDADYLVTLDHLQRLQGTRLGKFNGTPLYLGKLEEPSDRFLTHRFTVFYILPNGDFQIVCSADCDLLGNGRGALTELVPIRMVTAIALKSLKIPDLPNHGEFFSWRHQMLRRDWLAELEEIAKSELGREHNLKMRVLKLQNKRW